MSELREIIGVAAIVFGLFFYVMGVAGLIRFDDVYMRIHASGKVSGLGIIGLLVGVAVIAPELALKAFALGLFTVITQPVASHAIALAAYRSGVPLHEPHRDDLGGHNTPIVNDDLEGDSAPARD